MGGLAQAKLRGLDKVRAVFVFGVAAYNLVRLPKLLAPTGRNGASATILKPGLLAKLRDCR